MAPIPRPTLYLDVGRRRWAAGCDGQMLIVSSEISGSCRQSDEGRCGTDTKLGAKYGLCQIERLIN